MFATARRIGVIGGGGFIGSWLVGTLLEACRGCDVLYNLAAEHRDDVHPVELYRTVNVDGALTTCSAAEALGIRKGARSGFRPRHSLRDALVDTIRHEFVDAQPHAAPLPAAPKP